MPTIARTFTSAYAFLSDQYRRAATSVALDIAEGAGEFRPGEKARSYRMARRSAMECAAILDIAERVFTPPPKRSPAHDRLEEIASMLTTMVRGLERRSP